MVVTMEGKPEVSRETWTAGVPLIDTSSSSTDTISATTDNILEGT